MFTMLNRIVCPAITLNAANADRMGGPGGILPRPWSIGNAVPGLIAMIVRPVAFSINSRDWEDSGGRESRLQPFGQAAAVSGRTGTAPRPVPGTSDASQSTEALWPGRAPLAKCSDRPSPVFLISQPVPRTGT